MALPEPDRDPLVDQLRRAARTSGRSTSDIARDAGIDRRQLARFLSGARRQLLADTAEALAGGLGLRLSLAPAACRRKPSRAVN